MGSSLRFEGVAAVLEHVRKQVHDELTLRLRERRTQGRHELPDEEINAICRIAGVLAKTAAADGIGEAYQLGVNKSAKVEDYERPTAKPPEPRF